MPAKFFFFCEYLFQLLGWENNQILQDIPFGKKVNECWLIGEGFPQEPQCNYFIYKQLEEKEYHSSLHRGFSF